MNRFLMMVLVALVATFGSAACADDDDGDLAAYCDLVVELDGQEDLPSDEQLSELQEVAPAEIDDEVDLVADRFKEANDDPQNFEQVFDDPDVEAAFEEIEAFEDENCPAGDNGGQQVDDTTTTDDDTTTTEDDTTTTEEDTTTTEPDLDDTTTTSEA